MNNTAMTLFTCSALLLGTTAGADQIKPIQTSNGTVSTQGQGSLVTTSLGGLGPVGGAARAKNAAGLIAGIAASGGGGSSGTTTATSTTTTN